MMMCPLKSDTKPNLYYNHKFFVKSKKYGHISMKKDDYSDITKFNITRKHYYKQMISLFTVVLLVNLTKQTKCILKYKSVKYYCQISCQWVSMYS